MSFLANRTELTVSMSGVHAVLGHYVNVRADQSTIGDSTLSEIYT